MKFLRIIGLFMLFAPFLKSCIPNQKVQAGHISAESDSMIIRKIFTEALTKGQCYQNLRALCETAPRRLSGSPGAEKAVSFAEKLAKSLSVDRVILQEVMVPHWVRGEAEKGQIVGGVSLNICALGGSDATPKGGVTAEVLEVKGGMTELATLSAEQVRGKFIFLNMPMPAHHVETFTAYGEAVGQRYKGAVEASKLGALGLLVRSMGLTDDDYPHTGSMTYEGAAQRIPAVALSTNSANALSKALTKTPKLRVKLITNCQTLPDKLSYNVVAEIKGSEKPEEFVLVGGHLDAWDNGDGAHDDGSGCMQSLEVLRLFKALNIKPKRTLRAVLFMNEENGLRGGLKYAELAAQNKEKHIAAIESDAGGFTPRGFGVTCKQAQFEQFKKWLPLLVPYNLHKLEPHGGGADIGPLAPQGTALIGYLPDSQRYFDFHHTSADVFSAVNRRELELGAASLATLCFLLTEYGLPQ